MNGNFVGIGADLMVNASVQVDQSQPYVSTTCSDSILLRSSSNKTVAFFRRTKPLLRTRALAVSSTAYLNDRFWS
jgi:hypothetical protein